MMPVATPDRLKPALQATNARWSLCCIRAIPWRSPSLARNLLGIIRPMPGRVRNPKTWPEVGTLAAIALALSIPGCGGGSKDLKSPPGPQVGRTLKPSDDIKIIGKRKESL